jgi:hypothetical protein
LGQKMALPERHLESIEAFLSRFPGVQRVMIDGTERPIARPQDPEQQKQNYSGKKKRHTRKHLAAVDETKRILILSLAREGKLHDKRFHDEDDIAEMETVGSTPDVAVLVQFDTLSDREHTYRIYILSRLFRKQKRLRVKKLA